MNKSFLERLLIETTNCAVEIAAKFVNNKLPPQCRYIVAFNDFDYNELSSNSEIPKEIVYDIQTKTISSLESTNVINLLCKDDLMPQWVNVSVCSVDDNFTYISITYSNRFVNNKYFYHKKEGSAPFHCLGPAVPANWEKGSKFNLNTEIS